MPTKSEIIDLATHSYQYVSKQVSDLVIAHKEYVKGERIWCDSMGDQARALGDVIDLLLRPLLIHMREHLYHMTTDTYEILHNSVSNLVELQDMTYTILKLNYKPASV